MDKTSVPDYASLIKQQFSLQEYLLSHHLKIESLIGLMLTRDLCTYKTSKLQHALLVICDLTNSAMKLNEEAMNNLIEINALETNSKVPPFSWH